VAHFAAAERPTGLTGSVHLQEQGQGRRFTSTTATDLRVDSRGAQWQGLGRWDGQEGFRSTFAVTRTGTKPGRAPARIELVITAPDGKEVWRTPATAPFDGGVLLKLKG
jgi:hypothetical protein